jgi:hypothetical protein
MRKTSSKISEDYGENWLYYFNHVDEHNRFKGLIEFPTIQCIKIANLLCKNEEMVEKYKNEYYNPEFKQWEVIDSLKNLKKDILNKRTSEEVDKYKDKIKDSIDAENWQWLWTLLQDLFLELLAKEHVDDIVELIHRGVDIENIINWYNKGKKILFMTAFRNVDYIKSIERK